MRLFRPAFIIVVLLATSSIVQRAAAQPSWGRGGGSDRNRGGGPGGPPNFGDMRQRLAERDVNRNGMLDPNEIEGGFRYFLERMSERSNKRLDFSKPIRLDDVTSLFDGGSGSSNDQRDRSTSSNDKKEELLLVPGFDVALDVPLVPDFNTPRDSPLLATGPLEKRYGPEILERAERTLRAYDANKDDVLDESEISRNRRWDPDPYDSDLNGDRKLNMIELAERYVKRYGNDLDRRSSSSGSSSSSSGGPSSTGSSTPTSRYGSRGPSSSSSSSTSSTSSGDDRLERYAESIFRRYDDNEDGSIDSNEKKEMSSGLQASDKNGDGRITKTEMVAHLRGFASSTPSSRSSSGSSSSGSPASGGSGSNGNSAASYRSAATAQRLEKMNLPKLSDFTRDDRNADGQIQMAEYSTSWTEAKVEEFRQLDLNNDGVVTPEEWLKTQGGNSRR